MISIFAHPTGALHRCLVNLHYGHSKLRNTALVHQRTVEVNMENLFPGPAFDWLFGDGTATIFSLIDFRLE